MHSLADHLKQLQSTLPTDGPGFSAALLLEGESVFELHHGMASLALKVPLSADSAYCLLPGLGVQAVHRRLRDVAGARRRHRAR
jgi:hypothetical protein